MGYGALEKMLKAQVNRLAIKDHVCFVGKIENRELPQYYQKATVFVAPSVVAEGGDQEGLGLVLAEALACKCPVVATNLPAIRDVIEHRKTGLLVPQREHTTLAEAILELLDNPEQANQLAAQGMVHVRQRFDWQVVAGRYSRIIRALMLSA